MYRDQILRYEAQKALCKDCEGKCRQDDKFIAPYFDIRQDVFYEGKKVCPYGVKDAAAKRSLKYFKDAKIPPIYRGLTWDDYKVTEGNRYAVASARTIRTDGAGIYIFGPQGTGKTMLTAIMAAEVAERGQTVLWSSVPALLDDIRDNVRTGEQSDAVKALSDVDLLVLDDMGTERLTGYALEKLFIIIDNRYNNYKTTVVTSNLSPTGLMKHIGAVDPDMAKRIVSRLMGMCEICEIHGRDMRMGG